jgi:hypothetical protein
MLVKKNIIVTNPSKIDVKQKEHDTAKSLCNASQRQINFSTKLIE